MSDANRIQPGNLVRLKESGPGIEDLTKLVLWRNDDLDSCTIYSWSPPILYLGTGNYEKLESISYHYFLNEGFIFYIDVWTKLHDVNTWFIKANE